MLFAELYKTMVNKVTFLGFRGSIAPPPRAAPASYSPLLWLVTDTQRIRMQDVVTIVNYQRKNSCSTTRYVCLCGESDGITNAFAVDGSARHCQFS